MRYQIKQYAKLTGESLPQLAKRISDLSESDIGPKTLWNWSSRRYDFLVFVDCNDKDIYDIKGIYKETKIL